MKITKNIIILVLLVLTILSIIGGVSANDSINETITNEANTQTNNHKISESSLNDNTNTIHGNNNDKEIIDKSTINTVEYSKKTKINKDSEKIESQMNNEKLGDTDIIYVAPNDNPEYGEGSETKPYASIKKAVTASKTGSGKIIIKEGTYKENNILIDSDKAISITGEGHVVIDGNGLDENSIFTIETRDVIIKNILFTNNKAKHGSAIFIEGNSKDDPIDINLNIDNCSFENLEASGRGAIYAHFAKGSLNIEDSSFTNNNANWGAICIHTCNIDGGLNLKINNSDFANNFANNGGALYLMQTGEFIIGNSSFHNNSASHDPATIYLSSCDGKFENCLIYNNNALNSDTIIQVTGTKVQIETDTYTMLPSNIGVINCIIENNSVNDGGAVIQLKNSNLDISYSSIANSGISIENTVIPNYNDDKPGNVIANNNWWGTNNPLTKLNGTNIVIDKWLIMNIITNNTKVAPGDEVKLSIDFNHIQTSKGELENLSGGVIPKESFNVQLTANKGILSSESLEIKNGETKDVLYTVKEIPDIINVKIGDFILEKLITDGSEPNLGIIYVSTEGNDKNNGSADSPVASISKAIELASIEGSLGQIIIREGTYRGHNYQITSNLTIIGQGNVVIDGEGEGRLFYMAYGAEVDKFSISNLTLTGSNNDIIYSFAKELILDNIIITNNHGAGDLITNYGNLTINNSKISGHTGGDIIYSAVSSLKNADIIIINSLFENNIVTSSTSDYGIIYTSGRGNLIVENSQFINNTLRHSVIVGSDNVDINVKNSQFMDNTATVGYGGAIRVASKLNLENSTFINNKAYRNGGAIYVSLNAKANISKSSFINNSAGDSYHGNAICNNGELSVNYCVLLTNITRDYLIYNENSKKSVNAWYNWWGSNDNPKALVSGSKNDENEVANVDNSNWIIMSINVPDSVYAGFKVKPSVDFNHYINGSVIEELEETIPSVNVNLSAIRGSLDNTEIISADGVASTIYTAINEIGDDIISFTSGKTTLSKKISTKDQNSDSTAIVSPETIIGFFDDNGLLNPNNFNELIFTGKFNDLNLTINKTINLTGKDALFNNVGFKIIADNVKVSNITFTCDKVFDDLYSAIIYTEGKNTIIENNSITYNAPNTVNSYAIYFDGADGSQLINNKINYDGYFANDNKTVAIYSIDSNNLNIKCNEIIANIPSVYVEYLPPDYVEKIIDSAGLLFENSKYLNLEDNKIKVNYNSDDTNYDTIYAVKLIKADNVRIVKNDIEVNGHKYTYALSIDGLDMKLDGNKIVSCSDDNYAAGLEIAGDSSAMIYNNDILAKANDVTYGIYSENYGHIGSELTINGNKINVESNTAYGIIIVTNKTATISNNDISSKANYTKCLGIKNGKANISKNRINADGSNIGTSTDSNPITPIETIGLYALNADITVNDNTIKSTGSSTINAMNSNGIIKNNNLISSNSKGDSSIKQSGSNLVLDNNKSSNIDTETPTYSNPTVTPSNKAKTSNPKQVIVAKNLKVKKSAKALKIKVSLKKLNGKILKNKKVTLKFRGKKYSAKTNKKAVAIFKITKKVLKKLKKGKTYKYTVSYGKYKLTRKISVKK